MNIKNGDICKMSKYVLLSDWFEREIPTNYSVCTFIVLLLVSGAEG